MRSWTFSRKLSIGLATVTVLTVVMAVVSVVALRNVLAATELVVTTAAQRLVDAERLHSLSFQKGSESRAYLLTGDVPHLDAVRSIRERMRAVIDRLGGEVESQEGRDLLASIARVNDEHERALDAVMAARGSASVESIGSRYDRDVQPIRIRLDATIDQFVKRQDLLLSRHRAAAIAGAESAARIVIALAIVVVLLAGALALVLSRMLSHQIGTAVRHVQTSSAELQAVASQQATGAKEQATAMAEITTTVNELLATSRQIAESAQRVAGIATETAGAAKAGDETVIRTQESVGSIRRQVELIVNHMLELGRKSQQVGGILEIINELAEQTNILAINATIEAAGAGEAGKRFAVVAEEIRKLADRVSGSTKDIRTLIDEVRSAVNTTVMATETGSKAAEAGARQFTDVATAFGRIANLVGTTTEAAREIELSTKQQSTAVEQVNVAIANVTQTTREAETASGQALQTAVQLADMSRDLARLVHASA